MTFLTMRFLMWVACQMGCPVTYRNDLGFAMCRNCHHQSEVHD